jgi:hypothetical protein
MGAAYYSPCAINVLQPPGGENGRRGVDTMLQLTPDIQTSLRVRQWTQLPTLASDTVQYHTGKCEKERNLRHIVQ